MMLSLRLMLRNCQTVLMIYTDYIEKYTATCCIIGIVCSMVLNRKGLRGYTSHKDFAGKVQ